MFYLILPLDPTLFLLSEERPTFTRYTQVQQKSRFPLRSDVIWFPPYPTRRSDPKCIWKLFAKFSRGRTWVKLPNY